MFWIEFIQREIVHQNCSSLCLRRRLQPECEHKRSECQRCFDFVNPDDFSFPLSLR